MRQRFSGLMFVTALYLAFPFEGFAQAAQRPPDLSGVWQRAAVRLVSLLPVEWLL